MKTCSKCKEEKELTEFGNKKTNNDKLQYECKKCRSISKKEYNRTKIGKLKLIYDSQVSHSKRRSHDSPLYSKKEFIDRFINDLDYERHYYSWVISNYSQKYSPSFDRKNDYKKYSFDNVQIMYWYQNNNKSHMDNKDGTNKKLSKAITGTNVLTGEKISFYSAKEASRHGFCCTGISATCSGVQKTHKGYYWKFKKLKGILAINKKGIIGNKGKIPWVSKDDLYHFKRMTIGKTILVGRKTYESLPKLSGRNIVVVGKGYKTLSEALKKDIDFIVGGKEIYQQLLPLCDEIHVSLINDDSDGDTTFDIPSSLKDRCIYYNFDID